MKVMWNAVTEGHQEIKQELSELLVSIDLLWLDVYQDHLQKVEHVKAWRVVFAHVLHFLKVRKDDRNQV